jgi:hypothetical protein
MTHKKPKKRDWVDLPLLPPRKRDWKKGTAQIGIFLRTKDGGVVQAVRDRATEEDVERVSVFLRSWNGTNTLDAEGLE